MGQLCPEAEMDLIAVELAEQKVQPLQLDVQVLGTVEDEKERIARGFASYIRFCGGSIVWDSLKDYFESSVDCAGWKFKQALEAFCRHYASVFQYETSPSGKIYVSLASPRANKDGPTHAPQGESASDPVSAALNCESSRPQSRRS